MTTLFPILRIACVFATAAGAALAMARGQTTAAERLLVLTAILALDWRIAWLNRRLRDSGV